MTQLRKFIHVTTDIGRAFYCQLPVHLPGVSSAPPDARSQNFAALQNNAPDRRRGIALLSCIVLTLFLGIMISAAFLSMDMQLAESEARIQTHDSFYTAEAGLDRAVFELKQNSTWWPLPNLVAPLLLNPADPTSVIGTYTVTLAPAPDLPSGFHTVWVRSTGVDNTGLFPRTILARVVVQNPTDFLVFTLGQLTLLSGLNQTGNLLAQDINFLVNTAEAPGPSRDIVINGNVGYMRNINSNVPINTGSGITISGTTALAPSIPFSGIDFPYYITLAAGGHLEPGNMTYMGNINRTDLGAANGVVTVQGDLHISGMVTESMVFVASGNIYIDGDITVPAGPNPPQIGLLSSQDVIISSAAPANLNINAFILADGGRFKAETGGVPKGTLNFTGAMAARGDSANPAIDLAAFPLRNVVYNPALAANLQIPFLPFIVSVVIWQETEPTALFPPP